MNQYLAGTSVNLPIEFNDDDGNPLQVTEVSYRIIDQNGQESVPRTSLALEDTTLSIASQHNQITPLDIDALTMESLGHVAINEVRTVEFDIVLADGNTIGHDISYILYPRERLIVGLNSFQTQSQAMLTASATHDVEVFTSSTPAQRVAGLIEARDRICQLSFVDMTLGQSYFGSGEQIKLNELTPRQFNALSERFKAALRKAQIAEANVVLGGGDVIEQMRQQGLTSQTIGETHETYRNATPLNMLVSKVTMRCLSDFLANGKKITRT
jgi:hypothetical protein